jgi:hypothetical protein
MLTRVIERLQTSQTIGGDSVVAFGASHLASSPYVCLKPEIHPLGRGLRVIAHYDLGNTTTESNANRKALELYIFNELPDLLSNWSYTDAYGNYVIVKDAKEYTDIVADNDDSTISMERLFYIPLIL